VRRPDRRAATGRMIREEFTEAAFPAAMEQLQVLSSA
jgi:hypothetical protein